jgi:hypothetical protein
MENLREFRNLAGENGYSQIGECRDGSTLWLVRQFTGSFLEVQQTAIRLHSWNRSSPREPSRNRND